MCVQFPPGVNVVGENTVFDDGEVCVVDFFVEGDCQDLHHLGVVRKDTCPFNLQPQTVVRVETGVPSEVHIG